MFKKILFPCILFLLLAAVAGPQVVSAGVDPLASPTPRPTERITAPVISGVNPDAVLSEGNQVDGLPSDSFDPAGIFLPNLVDSPLYVDLKSQSASRIPSYADISRNFEDVNCGAASLAQALKILDPKDEAQLPTTKQLSDFMSARGLVYEWGTGVEELVYTAREFGFEGSIPFHNWTFERLTEYLYQGKPVVVSLGMNGADKPGHFVTVTGISEDGKWITLQDPSSGESILSREEFLSLWQLQGSAGMIPSKGMGANQADPMLPWMGLFGVISALALTLNQTSGLKESRLFDQLRKELSNPRRKGIGGGPLPPKKPEVIQVPRYELKTVYRGIKSVEVEVPVFETRKVKVGIREIQKEVPQYETRRIQVGVETITRRAPVYKTKKVKIGTRMEKKEIPVTRYKTKNVMVWKKYIKRVPDYRYIGSKKIVVGYKNVTSWKRVPVTKKVPYQTTKTISVQVPVYKEIKVVSGYKNLRETVPKYEQRKILVGHKTVNETVPAYEDRKVQIGTRVVTREMPQYETVRIPIVDAIDPATGPNGSPPTGFSAEIWKSLSADDQQKLRQEGIDWATEKEKIDAAKENWIYKTYLRIQGFKEKIIDIGKSLGIPISSAEPKNMVSLSAYKGENLDLLTENGLVIDSYVPPNILSLLYMEQNLSIQPKVVVTAFPGGQLNLNLSSQSLKVNLGDFALFVAKGGEVGYSQRIDTQDSLYQYMVIKHSIIIGVNGITYKFKKEGVNESDNLTGNQLSIKEVETLQCKLKTIKTEGVLILTCSAIILASIAYIFLTTGTLIPVPIS